MATSISIAALALLGLWMAETLMLLVGYRANTRAELARARSGPPHR